MSGHRGAVLDLAWCPHNDDIIASASEDCTVKVWQIPEGGLRINLDHDDCVADLQGHQRRVGNIKWHPSAANILVSVGSDNKVLIWNCGTEEIITEVEFPDLVLSISWNYIGNRLLTACKDKKLRIIDPRSGEILKVSISNGWPLKINLLDFLILDSEFQISLHNSCVKGLCCYLLMNSNKYDSCKRNMAYSWVLEFKEMVSNPSVLSQLKVEYVQNEVVQLKYVRMPDISDCKESREII